MDVGRRSLSSENEFRERRSGRKKTRDVPLGLILSFNDKDVHPECPNVSNPYHKCGRHCLDEIPSGKNFLDAIRSDADREWEKKSEKRGVNPNCPCASNPYHKCAEYCLEEVPEKRQDAGKDQPGVNPKKEVFTTERVVKPACVYASKPYHACAESCLQTVPEKDQPRQSMRLKGFKEGEKVLSIRDKTGLQPQCKHASNRSHECDESCFQSVTNRNLAEGVAKPKEESEIIETVEQIVNLEYKNASNTSHICPEFCSESVPESDRHEQVIRLKSTKEGDKLLNNRQGTGFDPRCKHASKSHHKCTEFCFENTPDRNLAEEENSKGVSMETYKDVHGSPNHVSCPYNKVTEHYFEKPAGAIKPKEESDTVVNIEQGVNLECTSASNPDHVRAEYCFQSVPEKERRRQKMPKGVSFKINESGALPNCNHVTNPYHEVVEYCFDDNPEQEHPNGAMKPKEERIVVGVDLVCKYAPNPYHECTEYCFQNLPIMDQRGKALMKSKENKEAVVPLEKVNPQCKHKSNPYHVCAEYCFQNVPNVRHPGQPMMKSKEEEKVVASPQVVNLDCKNASNPYHVCAEYCFENANERDAPKQRRGVSPECKFASNPYHVCAEYCFQKAVEREQHGQVMKQKSLKELKNLVSNKKITSEHPQCEYASNPYHQCLESCFNKNIPGSKIPDGVVNTNERKKEKSYAPRRDDNPKYKNASNCAEDCPEEISPKNEAVDGSTATVKERRRNSSKINQRNHPIVEKICRNSKYMATSKPSQNHIESSEGIIILQDGTEKSCLNSKFVEAFNQTNNNFHSNNGISMYMPDETKDFQADEPRLRIDAPDLSHEWSKYCSRKKVAVDEIVEEDKKVGIGEFATRNGKGNGFLKDYDSVNMEKRRTWKLKG